MHERDAIWYSVLAGLHMKVGGECAGGKKKKKKVTKCLSTHVRANEVVLNLHVQALCGRAMATSSESRRCQAYGGNVSGCLCLCLLGHNGCFVRVCVTLCLVCVCVCARVISM